MRGAVSSAVHREWRAAIEQPKYCQSTRPADRDICQLFLGRRPLTCMDERRDRRGTSIPGSRSPSGRHGNGTAASERQPWNRGRTSGPLRSAARRLSLAQGAHARGFLVNGALAGKGEWTTAIPNSLLAPMSIPFSICFLYTTSRLWVTSYRTVRRASPVEAHRNARLLTVFRFSCCVLWLQQQESPYPCRSLCSRPLL